MATCDIGALISCEVATTVSTIATQRPLGDEDAPPQSQ
jgi:hypothetical protein